ncbi:MAG: pyrroloquinoline-quinone synthase PqqC, partial [Solirubrobacterales bacterium]|nr:pyrroloquinoline-quinone synthase PqqC [Solirubrobacterales bacterium]
MGALTPWPAEELVAQLRAQGSRYHDLHPFHVRMDTGELTREELRRWVANRFCYQRCIPIKDAAILSNCPEIEVRRAWIKRIIDHDGTSAGTGGIESWLRLGEALGVPRDELLSERRVLPAVRYAVDAYVN